MGLKVSSIVENQKVAIYIRVSTHWQIDKDSLQVQKRELSAYSELVLGISDYVVFEDAGFSAKNTDRPDYQSMMDRLRTGEFSHLLVWKIDRISRNLLDFAQMYEELKDLGVTFVSKFEQFDTSTAIGEAMLKIILVFAELERQMTAERVTAVMMSRANNGQWNGGRIPYGYSYDKKTKTFSINQEEAVVYNKIVNLYEENQSILYVVRHLNASGIASSRGVKWSGTAVHKILTSVWYKGEYRYNVLAESKGFKKNSVEEWITIPNHHEPLISEERFDRIQFLLKRNRRGGVPEGKTYVKKNIHIFAGLLQCGKCGQNMSATLDRRRADGWRPSIYGCSTRRSHSKECDNKYVSDVTIGPFVFNLVANILKARLNSSDRSSLETFEKKILRGDALSCVKSIEPNGLHDLFQTMTSGNPTLEYKPPSVFDDSQQESEFDLLEKKRIRCESALSRLQSLFLYGDEAISEKDYVIEKAKLQLELEATNKRLNEIKEREESIRESEITSKASYLIMTDKLLSGRTVDYEKYIRSIDPSIPRTFIRTIIHKIMILDGRVTEVTFSNGITLKFNY